MSRLSALLLGTTIALVPPQIANALSAPEVAKVAEKVTVEDEKLGNSSSATIGQTVYIAGAPPSSQAIPVRTRLRLRVSPGKIIGIASQASEGYTLIKQSPSDKEEKEKTMEGWLWVAVELFVLCVVLTVGVFLRTTHKLNRRIMFLVAAQLSEHVPARYHKLRDLLSAGEWKKADLETRQVMLQVAGREKEGWQISALENFPCEDLRAIDKLWVKYSHGRFGFSVQKRIGLEEGGNICNWGRVLEVIGWLRDGDDGVLVTWQNLTFDLGAPRGHLPSVVIGASVGGSVREEFERIIRAEVNRELLRLIEKQRSKECVVIQRWAEEIHGRQYTVWWESTPESCDYGQSQMELDDEFYNWMRREGEGELKVRYQKYLDYFVCCLCCWVCLAHRCVNCSI